MPQACVPPSLVTGQIQDKSEEWKHINTCKIVLTTTILINVALCGVYFLVWSTL